MRGLDWIFILSSEKWKPLNDPVQRARAFSIQPSPQEAS
jgi:hypothetical protein